MNQFSYEVCCSPRRGETLARTEEDRGRRNDARGSKNPFSPDLARVPERSESLCCRFLAEAWGGKKERSLAFGVGVASGLCARKQEVVGLYSTPGGLLSPRREEPEGARAPHVSDWGTRPGGGRQLRDSLVTAPVYDILAQPTFRGHCHSCPCADPFSEPLAFCRLTASSSNSPGVDSLVTSLFFLGSAGESKASSTLIELVSRASQQCPTQRC